MVSDKDRLYVALYLRGGKAKMPGKEDTYDQIIILLQDSTDFPMQLPLVAHCGTKI